jgi:hypothetical protein
MYVYGGFDGRRPWDDLYRLDADTLVWDQLSIPGLGVSRSGHAAALCGVRHNMQPSAQESTLKAC